MQKKLKHKDKQCVLPSWPDVSNVEISAVVRALKNTYLSRGPLVKEFEEKLARYVGTRYAVAVSSGTAALHLVVESLGIGRGDLVITTPISFIASSNCLLYVGAKPVFVDVDPVSLNIDPVLVEKKIIELRKNPRTRRRLKAILAVDIFGVPARWDKLERIAHRYRLKLIEDAGEAMGAELLVRGSWRKAGSFGDVSIVSFTYNKQMTTGEGGVLFTNDRGIAELARSLKNHGRAPGGAWLNHVRLGYNYHISDINVALGIAQLGRIKELLRRRTRAAELYSGKLHGLGSVESPSAHRDIRKSWFVYVIRLPLRFAGSRRDRVIKEMFARGIHCRNYFPPIHLQPFYKKSFGYKVGMFPIAEGIASRSLSLPFYSRISSSQVDYVVKHLKNILNTL